jgi:hypothetical protein
MPSFKPVDIIFCRRIAYEEWRNFKLSQDRAIEARLNRQTGYLHAGGGGRKYSITTSKQEIVASLLHADYERYQDIKRLKHGRTNSRLHTPKITQTKGKQIHNRLIWGRMNTIAFRCINDLRGEVIKHLRESKIMERKINISF